MNKDRIVGAGRNIVGKGERKLGDTIGNGRLETQGLVDEVAGAVQNGFGRLIDRVTDLAENAPDMFAEAVVQSRNVSRRGNVAVRERLGDNGAKYLVAGAFALLALGAFAARRR